MQKAGETILFRPKNGSSCTPSKKAESLRKYFFTMKYKRGEIANCTAKALSQVGFLVVGAGGGFFFRKESPSRHFQLYNSIFRRMKPS